MTPNPSAHRAADGGNPAPAPVVAIVAGADGAAIPVTVYGAGGPVLIFVHGWSCGQDFWRFQADALTGAYRVVTIDLPGHGLAGSTRRSGWSMGAFGEDVVAVADWLGADTVTVIGHSMGGAVAIEAALRLGRRCRRLVGVDTFTEAAFYTPRPTEEIAARCAAFVGDFSGRMRGMVGAITAPEADADVIAWIGEAMASSDPAAALGILGALLAWDIGARWPELTVPAVAINSAMLARRNELLDLPGLDVRLMEGVGHFPMMEDPNRFNAMLADALK